MRISTAAGQEVNSMARRDEAKKQRRQKRLQKRRPTQASLDHSHDLPELRNPIAFLKGLKGLLGMPEPARWPGGCDATLARPDMVKLDFAEWVSRGEPGKSKLRRLEVDFRKGVLGYLPEMDHWAMEEFLLHGFPGDPWHPLDAYLAAHVGRYPPPACAQLRLWKEARLSLLEVGEVRDDLAELRAWDPLRGEPCGPWLPTIALNIGGVHFYRKVRGYISVTYLAPWAPQDQIFCAMGYGTTAPKVEASRLLPLLGLQHPEIICRPMPWKVSRNAAQKYLRIWHAREWHSWLLKRLQFPFRALIGLPPPHAPIVREVVRLIPSSPQQAHDFGIYFDIPLEDDEASAIGATAVTPLDVASPNLAALREYSAYRERVGPPPGTIGQSSFQRLR